jgi:hypothetical protein
MLMRNLTYLRTTKHWIVLGLVVPACFAVAPATATAQFSSRDSEVGATSFQRSAPSYRSRYRRRRSPPPRHDYSTLDWLAQRDPALSSDYGGSPVQLASAAEPIARGEPTDVFDNWPLDQGLQDQDSYNEFNSAGQAAAACCPRQQCCQPSCFPGNRFWVGADYLLWWVKGFSTPPLVTTSPVGTAQAAAGVLGQPGTSVLAGGNDLGGGARSGGRVRAGYWFDPGQTDGIEASYFALASNSSTFQADSIAVPILARPFYNAQPGSLGQDSELVSYPNLFSGTISVHSTTSLQGGDILLRGNLYRTNYSRLDVLAGYRYAQLNDNLTISDSKTVLSTASGLPVGSTLSEFDNFKTRNVFNGVAFGLSHQACHGLWSLESWAKVALGDNYSRVAINGQAVGTTPTQGGTPVVTTIPAGLLAQSTNIGNYSSNHFAVIPEFGTTIARNLTPHWRATFGYTFFYWNRVARPGNQIDTALNLSQLSPGGLSGPARPVFPNAFTDLWAQGLNFGLDCRF